VLGRSDIAARRSHESAGSATHYSSIKRFGYITCNTTASDLIEKSRVNLTLTLK